MVYFTAVKEAVSHVFSHAMKLYEGLNLILSQDHSLSLPGWKLRDQRHYFIYRPRSIVMSLLVSVKDGISHVFTYSMNL